MILFRFHKKEWGNWPFFNRSLWKHLSEKSEELNELILSDDFWFFLPDFMHLKKSDSLYQGWFFWKWIFSLNNQKLVLCHKELGGTDFLKPCFMEPFFYTPSQKINSPSRNKKTRRRIWRTNSFLREHFFNFSEKLYNCWANKLFLRVTRLPPPGWHQSPSLSAEPRHLPVLHRDALLAMPGFARWRVRLQTRPSVYVSSGRRWNRVRITIWHWHTPTACFLHSPIFRWWFELVRWSLS